jgi:uncharacterized protein (TIGR02996 family)
LTRETKRRTTGKKKPAKAAKAPTKRATKDRKPVAAWELFDPTLEAQIAANPDDNVLRSVYADWLIDAGNPRGELAALQLAGKDAEAKAFIAEHADALLGPVTGKHGRRIADETWGLFWRAGFWDGVRSNAGSRFSALLGHPSGRLLRALHIEEWDSRFEPFIEVLADAPRPVLRTLVLGPEPREIGAECDRTCSNLALLATVTPRLEWLRVRAADVRIASHPMLRGVSFRCTTRSPAATLRALFAAKLPALQELSILIETRGAELPTVADFEPLLSGTEFPALRKLTVWCHVDDLDENLAAAAKASPLSRLAEVDFAGYTSPDGA